MTYAAEYSRLLSPARYSVPHQPPLHGSEYLPILAKCRATLPAPPDANLLDRDEAEYSRAWGAYVGDYREHRAHYVGILADKLADANDPRETVARKYIEQLPGVPGDSLPLRDGQADRLNVPDDAFQENTSERKYVLPDGTAILFGHEVWSDGAHHRSVRFPEYVDTHFRHADVGAVVDPDAFASLEEWAARHASERWTRINGGSAKVDKLK